MKILSSRLGTRAGRGALVLLLASGLLLVACDNFERNAYRTLKVTKVEYELLQEHAARAFLQGRLTQEQWDHFAVAGHRFIAAHTLAADLMRAYQQVRQAKASVVPPPGLDSRQRLDVLEAQVAAALAELPRLLADLRTLLDSFQSQNSQSPPPQADAPRAQGEP
ncbi:MAG: hypothetical protein HY653_01030 [Acidobacteria bacterium]|nr:hypothetical protein [Acidobacteriota bacterium]